MREIRVLGIHGLNQRDRERICAVDPAIRYIDGCGRFDGEIRASWNAFAVARYLDPESHGSGSRAERDAMLAGAEIIYGGWPYPLDIGSRAKSLKWYHLRNAGASNLLAGDLWGKDILVTTARGLGNTRAMAEYVAAAILHFSRGLHRAETDRQNRQFRHRSYRPILIENKTVCVIGAGGIGLEVAKLCTRLGMHVIGTRRAPDASPPSPFTEIGGSGDLERMLGKSDFVAVCCQWTPETTHLINARTLAAMKPGAVLINVARGEIIDEIALVQALRQDRLRGVALDVYNGEFERNPAEDLWSDPRVLITPHVSAGTDMQSTGSIDLFCRNLRAYIDGKPLENLLDWQRGY